ncbi:MAG: hypothetical protein WC637_01855, partial [Victivallales bacterium]|jgi:hypothetical protein
LAKLKEAEIDPDAISQQESVLSIVSRDFHSEISVKQDGAASKGNADGQSEVNEKFARKSFTDAGKLPAEGKLHLNSRYGISNLADLYEWRIANELLFCIQKTMPQCDFYYVPAVVAVTPGPMTHEDFYAKISFDVTVKEKDKGILQYYEEIYAEKPKGEDRENQKVKVKEKEKTRWLEANDEQGQNSKVHLLALTPFRQFDNRSEALSARKQFLMTLAAAATAKAGPANMNLDSCYSVMKRLENDFAQIVKAPVVTSFVSGNRRTFGWNIYPAPAIDDDRMANVMTPDTWRFSAIVAIDKDAADKKVFIKPRAEWVRLANTWNWFTTDSVAMPDIEPIVLKFESRPIIYNASAEGESVVKVSGISLKKLKQDQSGEIENLKIYPVGSDKDKAPINYSCSFSSGSSLMLHLGTPLEDKKSYRVVWTEKVAATAGANPGGDKKTESFAFTCNASKKSAATHSPKQ